MLVKIKDIFDFKKLCTSIETYLDCYNIQLYYPFIILYKEMQDETHINQRMHFKSYYHIHSIKNKITNNIYNVDIIDETNNIDTIKVFIKSAPILNPYKYISNEYSNVSKPYLSCFNTKKTIDKVNSIGNAAYIDAFFSHLVSKLVINNVVPSFPIYYGTLSCISKDFKFDITEEYTDMKYRSWYYNNLNKIFREIESENRISNRLFSKNIKKNSVISYDSNIYIIDDSDSEYKNIDNSELIECNLFNNENISDNEHDNKSDNKSESDNESDNEHDNKSESDNESDNESDKYIGLYHFPVQLIILEKLGITLTEFLEINKDNSINEDEILSILFQICFALAILQKKFSFVHNDLHASNIMFKNTEDKYIYYSYNGNYYRIPTFNKIVKIIDFGRATFFYNGRYFISDVFSKDGDAEGQVVHPTLKEKAPKPNPSFDLAFLSTTIIEYFDEDTSIGKLLKKWTKDRYGNYLYKEENDFDLYVKISNNIRNVIPKYQLNNKLFKRFKINKNDIDSHIYKL